MYLYTIYIHVYCTYGSGNTVHSSQQSYTDNTVVLISLFFILVGFDSNTKIFKNVKLG